MRTFKYRTWGGSDKTVEADVVEFAPHHVVFLELSHATGMAALTTPDRIVLAEKAENVNGLREVTEE